MQSTKRTVIQVETETNQAVNGVDVSRLYETIEAVQGNPDLAPFEFRAENRWLSGGHNRSTIAGFHGAGREDDSRAEPFVLDADEPDVLLGADNGANPVEHVLHALAGCLTTSLVYHAAARGIEVEAVEARLEGDLDLRGFLGISDEVRNGYERIRVSYRIKGVDEETAEELVRIAQARSPVFDIVTNGVPVGVDVDRR
jgi:uncharacterized OsmC-like protein